MKDFSLSGPDRDTLEHALLERNGKLKGNTITFLCPSHDDHNPSADYDKRKCVWHCHSCKAGGGALELMAMLGIDTQATRDAKFNELKEMSRNMSSTKVTKTVPQKNWDEAKVIYQYHNEEGVVVYEVARFEANGEKTFAQRTPRAGGYDYKGPSDDARVLYQLPLVLTAKALGETVHFCEGEKDAQTLEAHGLIATCIANGANAKWLPQFSKALAGCNVVVFEDNDQAGREFSARVMVALKSKVNSLKLVRFKDMATKSDVTDYLARNSLEQLHGRVANAKNVARKAAWLGSELGLAQFEAPNWVVPNLIPQGLTILAGAQKQGKSFLALQLAMATATGGRFMGQKLEQGDVLYYDMEVGQVGMQGRLRSMLDDNHDEIAKLNRLEVNFESPLFDQNGLSTLDEWCERVAKPKLVVVDVLRRAFGGKFDSNSYDNVTMNLGPLHQWAQQNGVCVLAVTHTRKAAKDVNPDSDPFELVSGSSAISSVADATLLLRRPRGVDASTLTVTGRSIAESTYNLKFDASLLCWQLADKQERLEVLTLPFALKRIYDAIANGANSVGVLANNLGLDKGNVSKWVTKLLDLGLVSKKQLGKNILLSVVFDTTNTTNTTDTTDTTDTTINRNVNAITNNDSCMDSCMDSCTTVVPEYNYQYNHNKPVLDDKTQDLPKTVVSVVSVVSNQHNHTDTTVVHADNLDNSDNLDNHAQPTIEIPSDAIALRNKADLDLLGQLHGGASKVVEMIVVDSDGTRLISLRDDDSTSKVLRLQGTLKRAMKCNGIVYARL